MTLGTHVAFASVFYLGGILALHAPALQNRNRGWIGWPSGARWSCSSGSGPVRRRCRWVWGRNGSWKGYRGS